ncbi:MULTISPECIES: methyltransferase [Paraburkholderia]|uniref:Methyltransferase n=1 Tax=Paraburkholderia madseniana TaxID=2599607 RepID=A0AAP5BM29_9BURK|nr:MULTISPECIES: methyltransferase [Paraburkholderia]MCX4152339.1 methyltransferase [Paraburkholderia madseniana]MCX4177816.1 methyltransferase [Paraburkholderia madseniana]MDN7155268.1 methyltransferase [Paraburkholderia sp. WS6]MDQ6414151.1 methyltransferase [Paraburkholderia madseniana]MDQ6465803.1 methyltransferase [Paraburkholderia madseniana]
MKLTKAQTRAMSEVNKLVALERRLTDDERSFVLENYHPGATSNNAEIGAFFTPSDLARDFSVEVCGGNTVVDLCAGIGALAYACEYQAKDFVCVESNAEYVRVGRKVMPDARWIHADVFSDWWKDLAKFDFAISNPPYGHVRADGFQGRYTGGEAEYKVIEQASRVAKWGVFLLPQLSAPFMLSGVQCFQDSVSAKCQKFMDQTGIELGSNSGLDTSRYADEWQGVTMTCEIVICDFEAEEEDAPTGSRVAHPVARVQPINQMDLFALTV